MPALEAGLYLTYLVSLVRGSGLPCIRNHGCSATLSASYGISLSDFRTQRREPDRATRCPAEPVGDRYL